MGALFFLRLFGFDLTMMAIIGLIMLIGIVKKNAIMMIDFALERLRVEHKSAEEAIFEAAVLRFRPIMMTTMAAILGALPIAIGIGAGADLRQPLGVAVVGGLLVSQVLTLFTTPVTYLYMEDFGKYIGRRKKKKKRRAGVPRCGSQGDELDQSEHRHRLRRFRHLAHPGKPAPRHASIYLTIW